MNHVLKVISILIHLFHSFFQRSGGHLSRCLHGSSVIAWAPTSSKDVNPREHTQKVKTFNTGFKNFKFDLFIYCTVQNTQLFSIKFNGEYI